MDIRTQRGRATWRTRRSEFDIHTLSCVKQIARGSLLCKTKSWAPGAERSSGLCNALEGWDADGGWQGGSKARGYVYIYSWFTLLCNRNEHKLVKQLYYSFRLSVVSYSLGPHGLQYARLPCPSASPRACSNSHPWSRWCHPAISSAAVPFSSYLKSFPASGSFLMSRLFASNGQLYSIKKIVLWFTPLTSLF